MKKNTNGTKVKFRSSEVEDSKTNTRLLEKNYSPLIVRKYQMKGWPMYIGLIVDVSLSDLDMVMNEISKEAKEAGLFVNDIQSLRDVCGYTSERLVQHYNNKKENCVEGVAVLWYADKAFISSLIGDFMTHFSCKNELYQIVNTLPHI